MKLNDFLNSTRSYELFMRSEGNADDIDVSIGKRWTLQRILIRGLIVFIEGFCSRHNLHKKKTFESLSKVFSEYNP